MGRGTRAILPMLGSARHGQAPRSLRPLPHRLPAHRRRPHRALQLALGAPHRRHVRPAHRGHRPGALDAGGGGRDPRRDALARPRLGRGARASAARTGRTSRRERLDDLQGARGAARRARARRTPATARRRSSTPSGSRRRPRSGSSATRAPAASKPYDPSRPHVIRFRVPGDRRDDVRRPREGADRRRRTTRCRTR